MDNQEITVTPEMILVCQRWLFEVESLAGCVFKNVEIYLQKNAGRVPDTPLHPSLDIVEFLSITGRCANEAISLASKTAKLLQPEIGLERLIQMLGQVRSKMVCMTASIEMVIDAIYWLESAANDVVRNNPQDTNLKKLLLYSEILKVLSDDDTGILELSKIPFGRE